jgi:RNA polymerase sigma-70 factor (ECF subfamily)
MERPTDEELVRRYQTEKGSSVAEVSLNTLFQRYHEKVASWCYHITGDVNSGADLGQEVFLKVFQGLDSFRQGSKFSTWLYSIARNHCLDELRSRRRRMEEMSEALPDELEDWSAQGADSVLLQRESGELLKKLIRESLDETETKVMTLHYVQELPLETISRLLGLTNASGAKAYVVSARRKLQRAHELWKKRGHGTKAEQYAE